MYESPIEVFTQLQDIVEEVHKQQDDYVYNYLFKIGVNVDKEELVKALQYDRHQYEKGYKDGYDDGLAKVNEIAEQIKMAFYYEFDELIPSIMADKIDEIVKNMR